VDVVDNFQTVEIESGLPKEFKKFGVLIGLFSIIIVIANISFQNKINLFDSFYIVALVLAVASLACFSFSAKVIVSENSYIVEKKILGYNINKEISIKNWKTIRVSQRPTSNGNSPFPSKFIQIDLSRYETEDWSFGDIFMSDHIIFDFDEDPKRVAILINKIQLATGFNVIFDNGTKTRIFPEYKKIRRLSGE
jgi:hypothetical protein